MHALSYVAPATAEATHTVPGQRRQWRGARRDPGSRFRHWQKLRGERALRAFAAHDGDAQTTSHYEKLLEDGPDYILYVLTDNLVDSYFPVVDAMQDAVDELEDQIVTDPSDNPPRVIFGTQARWRPGCEGYQPQLEVFALRLTAPGYGVVSEVHAELLPRRP